MNNQELSQEELKKELDYMNLKYQKLMAAYGSQTNYIFELEIENETLSLQLQKTQQELSQRN